MYLRENKTKYKGEGCFLIWTFLAWTFFNRSQTRSPFLTMAAFLREATTQIYAFRDPVYV